MDTNALLVTGHIPLWFLILGLILPRLTVLIAYIDMGLPPNPLPDLVNFVLWLVFPRFLIATYIYADSGTNIWFWIYVIAGVIAFLGEGGYARGRVVRKRTTVSRDGRTTTTVEEEEV
jgi:hypothetical protein